MADQEQLNEESAVEVKAEEIDPSTEETNNEAKEVEEIEENEIVLTGQETETGKSVPKNTNFVFERKTKKIKKLQDQNAALLAQAQLQQMATSQPVVNDAGTPPDEYDFDNRKDYLKAQGVYDQQLMDGVVKRNLGEQQNAHRITAVKLEQEKALEIYTKSAAALKVSDYDDAQDKAFELLGDQLSQELVYTRPKEAPKIFFWLSRNPQEAADFRDKYLNNPGDATFLLGELSGKLTIKPKRSNAADPETKVENASVGGGGSDWQKQIDKINDDATDKTIMRAVNAIQAVKKQAKEAGFDVSTLK